MAYQIQVDPEAAEQIQALPAPALIALAEAMTLLQVSPWDSEPYHADNPDGAMRTLAFGPHGEGMIVHQIQDELDRVDMLRVLWAG